MKDAIKPNLMQTLEVSTDDLLLGSEKTLRATGLVQSSQSVWVCSAQSWGFTVVSCSGLGERAGFLLGLPLACGSTLRKCTKLGCLWSVVFNVRKCFGNLNGVDEGE